MNLRASLVPATGLLLAFLASNAWAGCTVSATDMAFGAYDTVNTLDVGNTNGITMACAGIGGGGVAYTIAFSTGSGTYTVRTMTNGTSTLKYNMYTTAARTTVWGDGTGGTGTVGGTFTRPPDNQSRTHTVYGRIPGIQDVTAGNYTTPTPITVTVNY